MRTQDNTATKLSEVFVLLAFAATIGLHVRSAQGANYSVFADEVALSDHSITVEGSSLPEGFSLGRRCRAVTLARVVRDGSVLAKGDTLTLNLFENVAYTASVDRLTTNVNGTMTVRGRIDGYPLGYILISTTGNRSLGSISVPEKGEHYLIQSGLDGRTHYLVAADSEIIKKLENGPSLIPLPPAPKEAGEIALLQGILGGGPSDPAYVDVMVVYTPAARQWAGGADGIANVIAQAMAKAQLALANSGTVLTMALVHSAEVAYTESGSSNTDLNRLTDTNDGYMDQVHTWRDTHRADLVALYAVEDDYGGLGWLLDSTSGRPAYAFCVVRVQQASWTYTHIHEMGHNMGCHHHKSQNVQPGPGLFSYSAGWRWTGSNNGKYCSIMTYEDGQYFSDGVTHTRVAHFSNPSVEYADVATGHAADGDNARTIRETKYVIAAYRLPPGVWVQFDYSGTESGTFERPYNTFSEGLTNVPSGGQLNIKYGGTSTWTGTIDKPMTITSWCGTTTVGQ